MKSPKSFCRDSGMTPASAHSTFNQKADLIMTGNVSSNVQSSTFVRARQQLECNGFMNKPGHLQEFDLEGFARNQRDMTPVLEYIRRDPFFESNTAIAYRFHHYDGKTRQLHGVIVTDEHHRIVRRFDREDLVGRRSAKSASVIDFCKQFVAFPAAGAQASA
jgi:hypothetical protein